MKKVLLVSGTTILVVIVIFTVITNFFDDSLSKREIFTLVNKNHELINECIESGDFSKIEELKGVKSVYSENDVLDVYCGGSGFGPSTNYYGFYYSPSNEPLKVWCGHVVGDERFLPEGKGYSIKNQNDDNWYYTEKIRDNFFYYESHF